MSVFSANIADLGVCFQLSRLQGEVAGLQFSSTLVDVLIADIDAEKQNLLTELREDKEDGTNSGSPDSGL